MIRLPVSKARFDPIENLYKVTFGLERIILHKHDKDIAAVISVEDLLLLENLVKKETISEQTNIEDNAHLAAIVESSEDAIIGKTLDGTIISWNPAAEILYGYSKEEILTRSISILIPKDRPNEVPEILRKISEGEHVKHYETIRISKDGREIPISLTISPIRGSNNRVIGASTIARNITEQKKAEEELKHSREQLRALSRRLQSIQEEERERISHQIQNDIGQVLTVLKIDIAWISKRLPINRESLQKKLENMKTLIDKSIESMCKMSTELRPKALDDLGLATAIEWEVRQFQKRTGINCSLNIPEEIVLDSARSILVFRILQESLNSLAKYTYHIDINIHQPDDISFLFIELIDNNFDISKQKSDVFSLDLISIQERALLLGGRAEVKQEVGKLIISIGIPLPKDTNTGHTQYLNSSNIVEKSLPISSIHKDKPNTITKILIADSHAIVREGLKQILAEIPDIIVAGEASNGQELLQKIRADLWDVLIMDISLPDKNGLELLKQIKMEFPKIPVLILSTQAEESYALRILKAGASGYLNKESAPDQLIQAIQKVAEGKQYISPSITEQIIFEMRTDVEKPLHKNLSDREFQILRLIALGKSLTEISQDLNLSIKTVSTYRTKLLQKMAMKNNIELVRYAITNKLII